MAKIIFKNLPDRTTPLNAQNLNRLQDEILDSVYPIGSIYMSINNVNPDTLFGGTWEQIKDTFLLSAGDTHEAGTTGGEETHTLSINEMPSHNHRYIDETGKALMNGYFGRDGTNQSNAYMGVSDKVAGYSNAKYVMENTGGGESHNNMPPYLTVYMWKRVS